MNTGAKWPLIGIAGFVLVLVAGHPLRAVAQTQSYYFCDDPKGYFPYVQTCKIPWRPVAAEPFAVQLPSAPQEIIAPARNPTQTTNKPNADTPRSASAAKPTVATAMMSAKQSAAVPKIAIPAVEYFQLGRREPDLTILSKEGLGTTHAAIRATLTRDNAKKYCRDQYEDSSTACIEKYIKNAKFSDRITANCSTGNFNTFFGDTLQFIGRNGNPDSMAHYIVKDLGEGTTLDGSSASGLDEDMVEFDALCPGRAASADVIPQPSAKPKATTASDKEMEKAWYNSTNAGTCVQSETPSSPGDLVTLDLANGLKDDVRVLKRDDAGGSSVVRVAKPMGNAMVWVTLFFRGARECEAYIQAQQKQVNDLK
jgi:hypothetical protein